MILLVLGAGFLSNKIIISGKFYIVGENREAGITVLSEPNNAEVFIGPNYVGKTPITITIIPGTHEITLKKVGYHDLKEYVELKKDESKDVFLELETVYGKIYVESIPTHADVSVDGIYKGITPKLIADLDDGSHVIKISKENYEDYVDYVFVGEKEKKVFVKLEKKNIDFPLPLHYGKS
ncbi:MAG: PEGA domain-containing protein [Nanoarchaeota archaeon]